MCYSESYTLLFSGGIDKTICVWNPYFDSIMGQLKGHTSPICSTAIVICTPQFVSGDSEGIVKIWDMSFKKAKFILCSNDQY